MPRCNKIRTIFHLQLPQKINLENILSVYKKFKTKDVASVYYYLYLHIHRSQIVICHNPDIGKRQMSKFMKRQDFRKELKRLTE